ncbi:MAG: hypothetical protein IKJ67_00235 [Bacteroidales bacterium]|nr:hypothetical protein [Bacteroidales bacterium]
MKVTITYKEITTTLKEKTKVNLSVSKYDERSLKVVYAAGIPFVPDIDIVLTVVSVYPNKLELTYSCGPLVEKAVEKLLPKLTERLPGGVVNINGKNIMINLAEVEQLEKVLKFLSLSDIVVNDNAIEVLLEVK